MMSCRLKRLWLLLGWNVAVTISEAMALCEEYMALNAEETANGERRKLNCLNHWWTVQKRARNLYGFSTTLTTRLRHRDTGTL